MKKVTGPVTPDHRGSRVGSTANTDHPDKHSGFRLARPHCGGKANAKCFEQLRWWWMRKPREKDINGQKVRQRNREMEWEKQKMRERQRQRYFHWSKHLMLRSIHADAKTKILFHVYRLFLDFFRSRFCISLDLNRPLDWSPSWRLNVSHALQHFIRVRVISLPHAELYRVSHSLIVILRYS